MEIINEYLLVKYDPFFKTFDQKKRTYRIYCQVSNDFGTLLKGVGFSVKSRSERLEHHSASVKRDLPIEKDDSYALFSGSHRDKYTAIVSTNRILEGVRALSFLNPNAPKIRWGTNFFVAQNRAANGEVIKLPESPLEWLSPQTTAQPRILKDIRRYSDKILLGFNSDGVGRILRSVSTASSARYAPNVESQLIALWSAVEGLLSEPPEELARIQHFSELMVPCVCNRHLHRRSVYLYDQLYASYGNKFRKIVNQEPDYRDKYWHYRLTAIFMYEKNADLREKLLNLACRNPLALHRMYQYYQDCKSPKNLIAAIENHEERVEWQLSRIYRVRNSLVHKVEKPDYLDSVVLNMFEYYIRMLSCIVRAANKTAVPSNLDQVVTGAYLESLTTKKIIKSKIKNNTIDNEIFDALHI